MRKVEGKREREQEGNSERESGKEGKTPEAPFSVTKDAQ